MPSIALSDNEGPKRQSSKPVPTVRGSKAPVTVAGGDLKREPSKPAPTVRGSKAPVKVAGGDPKRQSSKPAPTVRGSKGPSRKGKQGGTKGGGLEQDIIF